MKMKLTSSHMAQPGRPPDGGYGWVIVFCAFCNMTIFPCTFFGFGVLYVELVQVFKSNNSTIALLGSLQAALSFMCNIISGSLVRRLGCRTVGIAGAFTATTGLVLSAYMTSITGLYVTFGCISGIGISLGMCPTTVIVQRYFDKKRALAAGITICGLSIGALVAAPLVRLLLDVFGLRGAFMMLGGIVLHSAVFCAAFRPLPSVTTPPSNGLYRARTRRKSVVATVSDTFDCSLWREPKFIMYTIGVFSVSFGTLTFAQHFVNFAVYRGVDIHTASFYPMIIGTCSLVFRLIFSFVANLKCTNRVLQYGLIGICTGVMQILSQFSEGNIGVIIAGCIFGVFMGGLVTIQQTVLVDLLGVTRLPSALGMSSMFQGASVLASSPLAGYLLDKTGSYAAPYSVTGVVMIVGSIVFCCILCLPQSDKDSVLENGITVHPPLKETPKWLGSAEELDCMVSAV